MGDFQGPSFRFLGVDKLTVSCRMQAPTKAGVYMLWKRSDLIDDLQHPAHPNALRNSLPQFVYVRHECHNSLLNVIVGNPRRGASREKNSLPQYSGHEDLYQRSFVAWLVVR